jgi:hypothetical protein
MKYICQHLGIGDHIITNGLVRTIIENGDPNEDYTMFVKPEYIKSVGFMFRDINKLKFMEGSAESAIDFLRSNNINTNDIIYAGFHWVDRYGSNFEENFYKQNNIDFENKWSKFHLDRDIDRENTLYDKFKINEDYIFLHDDKSRGFIIDSDKIPSNIRIIRPDNNEYGYSDNIFDYIKIIENAKSVHCIESSFLHIIDIMNLNKDIFLHSYSRIHPENFFIPKYKNTIIIK